MDVYHIRVISHLSKSCDSHLFTWNYPKIAGSFHSNWGFDPPNVLPFLHERYRKQQVAMCPTRCLLLDRCHRCLSCNVCNELLQLWVYIMYELYLLNVIQLYYIYTYWTHIKEDFSESLVVRCEVVTTFRAPRDPIWKCPVSSKRYGFSVGQWSGYSERHVTMRSPSWCGNFGETTMWQRNHSLVHWRTFKLL